MSTVIPLVPFVMGVERLVTVNPIIGPPANTRAASDVRPPQCSISDSNEAPIGTSKFFGETTPAPVTVMTRCVNARPRMTAAAIAADVATLTTTMPRSSGRPAVGTSR